MNLSNCLIAFVMFPVVTDLKQQTTQNLGGGSFTKMSDYP